MSFAERLFRSIFVAVLGAGLVLSVSSDNAGFAGLFGMLLGTALERLITRS